MLLIKFLLNKRTSALSFKLSFFVLEFTILPSQQKCWKRNKLWPYHWTLNSLLPLNEYMVWHQHKGLLSVSDDQTMHGCCPHKLYITELFKSIHKLIVSQSFQNECTSVCLHCIHRYAIFHKLPYFLLILGVAWCATNFEVSALLLEQRY